MALGASLTPRLREEARRIEGVARSFGLDFFPVVFEMLDARDVNAVAAYGGFPVRYPSWRFGMEYERLEKGHRYGLSKIYELVINNDPTYAYLVRTNSDMEQKLVMAHVFGHADSEAAAAGARQQDRSPHARHERRPAYRLSLAIADRHPAVMSRGYFALSTESIHA